MAAPHSHCNGHRSDAHTAAHTAAAADAAALAALVADGCDGAGGAWRPLPVAAAARRTTNPIRAIVDRLRPNPAIDPKLKPLVALSIGDPTLDGNFPPPPGAAEAIARVAAAGRHNGYPPAVGSLEARAAVAAYLSGNFAAVAAAAHRAADAAAGAGAAPPAAARPPPAFTPDDVILACGASQALQLVFGALCDPGSNVLLPEPMFPLYATLCDNAGVEARYYRLLPERGWEVDLAHAASLCDAQTRLLLLSNPSNPTGANFRAAHVAAICAACAALRVPVVSDEVYAGMVFAEGDAAPPVFTSVADVPFCAAPRIVVGGTAKNFMVPGWRLGWVAFLEADAPAPPRVGAPRPPRPPLRLSGVVAGVAALSTLVLGPCSLVQGTLPAVLAAATPDPADAAFSPAAEGSAENAAEAARAARAADAAYRKAQLSQLASNAAVCAAAINAIPGLSANAPAAAMYVLCKIDFAGVFKDSEFARDPAPDVSFAAALLSEENVVVLPGTIFRAPGYVRVVFTKRAAALRDGMARLAAFCARHTTAAPAAAA